MTEQEAIERISKGDQVALGWVYIGNQAKVIAWLLKQGVDEQNTKDIWHEIFIIFEKKVRDGDYVYTGSAISSYLIEIAKNKQRDMDRNNAKKNRLEEILLRAHEGVDALSVMLKEQYFQKIEKALEAIGEPCRSLLWLTIVEEKKYEDIIKIIPKDPDAEQFEQRYKDADTAKNQRCRCLIRLTKLINQSSDNPPDHESII